MTYYGETFAFTLPKKKTLQKLPTTLNPKRRLCTRSWYCSTTFKLLSPYTALPLQKEQAL